MKLLSAAALSAYAAHSVSATSHSGRDDHTESETGFVSVTKTQVHTRVARSVPLAEHLSSLRPEQVDAHFTATAASSERWTRHDSEAQFHTESLELSTMKPEDKTDTIFPPHTEPTADWTNLKNRVPLQTTSQVKRDIQATQTSFVTASPTIVTYTPSLDTAVIRTLPAATQIVTATRSQSPKPPADFYRLEIIDDECRASHPVKRCRLLAKSLWWPAGGKECWCIKAAKDPGGPARPTWDPSWIEGWVDVHIVPPPAQAVLDADGNVVSMLTGAYWMQAVPTKAAFKGRD